MRDAKKSSEADKLLLNACLDDLPELARQALDDGADPNCRDYEGYTPLAMCACNGNSLCIDMVLPLCDPLSLTDGGLNALMVAIVEENLGAAEKLLPICGTGHHSSNNGATALHLAADGPGPEFVRLLLQAGADPNAEDGAGQTPMHVAAFSGDCDSLRELLAYGFPDAQDCSGNTPLHLAIYEERIEAIRMLSSRSSIDIPNSDGLTALDLAESHRSPAVQSSMAPRILAHAEKPQLEGALRPAASPKPKSPPSI